MLENYSDVLAVNDLCKILHIGKNVAYRLLQSGEIPNKRINKKYIIPKSGVIAYINTCLKSA